MNDATKFALAGTYCAICAALGEEISAKANEFLRSFAADPRASREEARIYHTLADSADVHCLDKAVTH